VHTSPRPAVQLYSIRNLREPLPDIIARVGGTTFEGVEFAERFREADPEATATALEEHDVVPVAAHADLLDIEEAIAGENDLLDRCRTVGCDRLVVPHVAPSYFRSPDTVRTLSDRLTDAAAELDAFGIELGYHTVHFDCYPFGPPVMERLLDQAPLPNGVANHARRLIGTRWNRDATLRNDTALWYLLSHTPPENLFFELESGGLTAAGLDPAAVLPLFAKRAPLVHLRDVAPTGRFGAYENASAGEGAVDFERLIDAASAADVEWAVYEDESDRPPATKIAEGAAFLDRLLDAGRRSTETAAAATDAFVRTGLR